MNYLHYLFTNNQNYFHDLVPYKGFVNEKEDKFYNYITDDYLYKASEEYLKFKKYEIGSKDYTN